MPYNKTLTTLIDSDSHAEKIEYDQERTRILSEYGLSVVRYANEDVLKNIEGVYDDLMQWVEDNANV